ncbi:hypothetical protein ACEQ8H_001281 [Pleosporales sp. CAS-2024a]
MRASLLALLLHPATACARFVMYADQWHLTRPTDPKDRAGIDHVVLAFAMANATAAYQPYLPISTIRSEFPNAKVMIAVGGWGDDIGFYQMSQTNTTINQFAADIATMLTNTGADGVDIDWEYPGGHGADYKQVPDSQKAYQIDAFPLVLAAIRHAIGTKLLSIAVPGKSVDMIAYTKENGPKIWPSVDFINVMSYDLMNRRDNVTKHHTSVVGSAACIERYLAIGCPPEKINLGMAYYAKYFTIKGTCTNNPPLGCPIVLAEDPVTGKDALTSGAWTFETSHMKPVDISSLAVSYDGTCGADKNTKCGTGCCSQYGNCGTSPDFCSGACQHAFGTGCTDADVAGSWQLALAHGSTDEAAGGQYYLDTANNIFWTWDTPALISRKFDDIIRKYKLGGVMAWSLGEDSFDWSHIAAMRKELAKGGFGSGEPSGHQSLPMIPAPAEPVQSAVAPLEQGPADPKAPHVASTAPAPSPSALSVVWVDGTSEGPAGDHSTQPGSPAGFVVNATRDEEASTPQEEKTPKHIGDAPVAVAPQGNATSTLVLPSVGHRPGQSSASSGSGGGDDAAAPIRPLRSLSTPLRKPKSSPHSRLSSSPSLQAKPHPPSSSSSRLSSDPSLKPRPSSSPAPKSKPGPLSSSNSKSKSKSAASSSKRLLSVRPSISTVSRLPAPSPAQKPTTSLPSPSTSAEPFSPEFVAVMRGQDAHAAKVTAAPTGKVDFNRKAARAPRKRREKAKGNGRGKVV